MSQNLPKDFENLESFVVDCIQADASARDALRGSMSAERRHAFHEAFFPRLEEALDLLDAKDFADYDEKDSNLMQLALTFAHIAQAVEVQGPDEIKHALSRKRLPIIRAPADI